MIIKTHYIKSPLNYVGGKYKLLSQIITLFPSDIKTFVDLFGGGFNVGINISCEKIIYNDKCKQVVDLLENFNRYNSEYIHEIIEKTTCDYGLGRIGSECDSSDSYMKLRQDYNENPDWIKFYTLITCSFSNQIRFNSKEQFNMPYGKRYYNSSLQEKLKIFVNTLNDKNITFMNKDFREFNFNKDNFIYADPPYFNSLATYNENGGWSEQDEIDLLEMLDEVHNIGGRFALSNNLKYNNKILDKWKNKYKVHYLDINYGTCNYQKKDKSKDAEILITNY